MNEWQKWMLVLLPLGIVLSISVLSVFILMRIPQYYEAIPIIVGFSVVMGLIAVFVRVFLGKWAL
ncbi:hypothetical protein HS7_03900 [Sulfolobales archaeon HS-7]|nr:hypothetical protein HS7_03900 [Sulfolobales archaeon HS-7]